VDPRCEGGWLRYRGREGEPPIYDLRHTYATMSLAAGVSQFTLARRMGTSVQMIDRTYGHLAPDAEEYERGLLDANDREAAKGATSIHKGNLS
jgi:integrase